MPTFKIRIDKSNKKAPHYRIVRAPSIQSAEYFALEHMLLPAGKVTLEDHFKLRHKPILNIMSRTERKSIFEFQSQMLGKDSPVCRVRIIRDNEAEPSEHYAREFDESIFELWSIEDDEQPNRNDEEPPFFTEADLKYFSSVVGKQFTGASTEADELKKNLAESGVFAKTDYWAKLLKKKGLVTEFRYDWQFSGRVRDYSWARVYLPELKSPDVFFTIGVGSRLSEGNVMTLEYKLDCRRDKLPQEKIKQFDDYVKEFCPESRRQKIEYHELSDWNWEALVDQTTNFIDQYKEEYEILTRLMGKNNTLPKKLARLCWNEMGWEAPSGPNGKSKTSAKSFEKEKGYGHEEWFFDTEKQIDGYHYAFLQAFNKGDHEGESYDIHLYAIKDTGKSKEKYWIGRVKNLEVLTKEEAQEIVSIYKKQGWLSERLEQLRKFNIPGFNFNIIPENEMFNVKFKVDSSNFVRYNPYRVIRDFKREIGSNHYVLLDKNQDVINQVDSASFKFSEGHNPETKKGQVTASYSGRSYRKNLLHEEIKESIFNQFQKRYHGTGTKVGTENETGHGTSVDLVVNDPESGLTFYEIKTGGSALSCIREALGQIIEYCYYPANNNATKLVIVSPYPIDLHIKAYMRHLRKTLGIEIYYQSYSMIKKEIDDTFA